VGTLSGLQHILINPSGILQDINHSRNCSHTDGDDMMRNGECLPQDSNVYRGNGSYSSDIAEK